MKNFKLKLYAIQHNSDDCPSWASPPFVAPNDHEAVMLVLNSLHEICKDDDGLVFVENNPDSLICIGSFDPMNITLQGSKKPKFIRKISDFAKSMDLLHDDTSVYANEKDGEVK